MAKGDQIHVAVRGVSDTFKIVARQNGRSVEYAFEKDSGVNWLVVKETTRGGTIVTENRFPADEVLVLARLTKEIVK